MTLECITCLEKGKHIEAEVIYDGYSFCLKHATEHAEMKMKKYDEYKIPKNWTKTTKKKGSFWDKW